MVFRTAGKHLNGTDCQNLTAVSLTIKCQHVSPTGQNCGAGTCGTQGSFQTVSLQTGPEMSTWHPMHQSYNASCSSQYPCNCLHHVTPWTASVFPVTLSLSLVGDSHAKGFQRCNSKGFTVSLPLLQPLWYDILFRGLFLDHDIDKVYPES